MPWIIDRDYIDTGAVGTCSRSWKKHPERHAEATVRFRMLDDDGNVYYGGRCTPDVEFQPLDNFGMPNAGCTTIQFTGEDGEWYAL